MDREASSLEELPALLSRSRISTTSSEHDAQFEVRNSEDAHNNALAIARAEHDRIRKAALQTFELHKLREAHLKLQHLALQEQERLRIDTARAVEEAKIRELQAQAKRSSERSSEIPLRSPSNSPAPALSQAVIPQESTQAESQRTAPPQAQSTPARTSQATRSSSAEIPTTVPSQPVPNKPKELEALRQPPSAQASGLFTASQPHPSVQPELQPPRNPPSKPADSQIRLKPAASVSHILPHVERYEEIHKNLKNLRKFIVNAGKQNPGFKKKTGEMRRSIRQSVGQLTGEKGANKQPMKKIVDLLKESLTSIPSPGVDPTNVMVAKPEPVENAANNGDKLPALFIYLLNIFAKAVVAQFVDEAGVSPKAADPIGVVAVSVFSQVDFYWRNRPLIDILIAKIRVSCPVVFGLRGNERTEEGRARLGWKKSEDGGWVPEQVHSTRMTGLGAGYAAICLRDFSKSRMTNPWPPTHYWQAIASVVSTPPDQTSSTQYIVLRALIDGCEQKFMTFYGNAARAALQVALVEFPGRALERSVAVSALEVLADKLKRDVGLQLR